MANSLNIDLTGRVAVVKAALHKPQYRDLGSRLFYCERGFGCSPHTAGRAVYGEYLANRAHGRREGSDFERLATAAEIAAALPLIPALEYPYPRDEAGVCAKCGHTPADAWHEVGAEDPYFKNGKTLCNCECHEVHERIQKEPAFRAALAVLTISADTPDA